MKNLFPILFALLISGTAFAQTSAPIQAEIIAPIEVTLQSGTLLNFGKFTAPQNGTGTVTVTSDGTFRKFSDSSMEIASLGNYSVPTFNVTRDTNLNYAITTTISQPLTEAGGNALSIDGLTVSTGRTGVSAPSFSVGGTISVPSTATTGVYDGEVTVTVAYE